jgi:hypothetical protein
MPAHPGGQAAARAGPRVIDALRRFAPSFLRQPGVSPSIRSTLTTLLQCRTPVLGGHRYECERCGTTVDLYNSCGSRHCTQCQGGRRVRWTEAQQELLLPVPHFQVVFTLPDELRPIARQFPREVYDTLFQSAYETLQKLARTKLDATLAVLVVLHTWSRELTFHPHVHCVVSAGGLDDDDGWVAVRDVKHLFHHEAMRRLFKGIFLSRLTKLGLPLDRVQRGRLRHARRRAAEKDWVVWLERPNDRDPTHLVKYLARYVYQSAISDHRIVSIDANTVTFRTRASAVITLPGEQFIRRYALHFLPSGFRRVRHYGLLASGARRRLEVARDIVTRGVPPAEPIPTTPPATADPRCCAVCGDLYRITLLPRDLTFDPLARGPP